jgi:multimeric flavodoxin WrbA
MVLENTGINYEVVSLRGKLFLVVSPPAWVVVKDNICKVDDLGSLREKIVEADAYVFGAPNYYYIMNAATHALMERWCQFRHQTGNTLWGNLA